MLRRLLLKSLLGLGLILIWQGCAASKMAHDANDIPGEYQKGMKFMGKKNWLKAEEAFTFIVYNDPAGEFADDAQFQLGETHYFRDEYLVAIDEYDRLINRMPNSPLLEEASWRKTECYYNLSPDYRLDQTMTKKATKQLQNFIDLFPQSDHRPTARKYLKELRAKMARKLCASGVLYLKLREWGSARVYFDTVLDKYYDTSFQTAASLGKAEALTGENKLDDAGEILAQIDKTALDKSETRKLKAIEAKISQKRAEKAD